MKTDTDCELRRLRAAVEEARKRDEIRRLREELERLNDPMRRHGVRW